MYFGSLAEDGGLRLGPPVRLGPGDVEVGRALVNSSKTIWREPSSWDRANTAPRPRQIAPDSKTSSA